VEEEGTSRKNEHDADNKLDAMFDDNVSMTAMSPSLLLLMQQRSCSSLPVASSLPELPGVVGNRSSAFQQPSSASPTSPSATTAIACPRCSQRSRPLQTPRPCTAQVGHAIPKLDGGLLAPEHLHCIPRHRHALLEQPAELDSHALLCQCLD